MAHAGSAGARPFPDGCGANKEHPHQLEFELQPGANSFGLTFHEIRAHDGHDGFIAVEPKQPGYAHDRYRGVLVGGMQVIAVRAKAGGEVLECTKLTKGKELMAFMGRHKAAGVILVADIPDATKDAGDRIDDLEARNRELAARLAKAEAKVKEVEEVAAKGERETQAELERARQEAAAKRKEADTNAGHLQAQAQAQTQAQRTVLELQQKLEAQGTQIQEQRARQEALELRNTALEAICAQGGQAGHPAGPASAPATPPSSTVPWRGHGSAMPGQVDFVTGNDGRPQAQYAEVRLKYGEGAYRAPSEQQGDCQQLEALATTKLVTNENGQAMLCLSFPPGTFSH